MGRLNCGYLTHICHGAYRTYGVVMLPLGDGNATTMLILVLSLAIAMYTKLIHQYSSIINNIYSWIMQQDRQHRGKKSSNRVLRKIKYHVCLLYVCLFVCLLLQRCELGWTMHAHWVQTFSDKAVARSYHKTRALNKEPVVNCFKRTVCTYFQTNWVLFGTVVTSEGYVSPTVGQITNYFY